jgi:hypothetical protein
MRRPRLASQNYHDTPAGLRRGAVLECPYRALTPVRGRLARIEPGSARFFPIRRPLRRRLAPKRQSRRGGRMAPLPRVQSSAKPHGVRDGATGLEPETSGVTGRSWPSGLSGDRRGFPARAGSFDAGVAGIAGNWRRLPAASCGICAGCPVVPSANEDRRLRPARVHVVASSWTGTISMTYRRRRIRPPRRGNRRCPTGALVAARSARRSTARDLQPEFDHPVACSLITLTPLTR